MLKYFIILLAYLLGSIPFSYLLGKLFKGQDIRKLGSGNIGTTNAFRVFGKAIGWTVLVLDTFKSGLIVIVMLHTTWFDSWDLFHPLIYGFASVLGHVFPVWFKFKGGKGVATSFGLLLSYNVWVALGAVIAFLITEFITRYVSVSSTIGTLFALILVIVMHVYFKADLTFVIMTFLATSLIIYRHKTNYQRLKAGNENRVKVFDKFDTWMHHKQEKNETK